MVIRDLNIKCITMFPFKTNSPLIVNSNAVLTFPVTAQFFKSICRRDSQIIDVNGVVNHTKFSQSHLLNIGGQLSRTLALIDSLCFGVFEGFDHKIII